MTTANFTQDDAFELDGCGAQGLKRAVWRRVFRQAPIRAMQLVQRKRTAEHNQQRVVEGVFMTDAQEWKARALKAETTIENMAGNLREMLKAEHSEYDRGRREGYQQCLDDNDLRPDC